MSSFTSLTISSKRARFVAAAAALALITLSAGAGATAANAKPAGPDALSSPASTSGPSVGKSPSPTSSPSASSKSVSANSGDNSGDNSCGQNENNNPSSIRAQHSYNTDNCCPPSTSPSSIAATSEGHGEHGTKSSHDCCLTNTPSNVSTQDHRHSKDSKHKKKHKDHGNTNTFDCCLISNSPSSGKSDHHGHRGHKDKYGHCIVPVYDINIQKSQTEANPVGPGQTVHYVLTVSNDGAVTSPNNKNTAPAGFKVYDPIPDFLTLVSVSGTGFSCTPDFVNNEANCTATQSLVAGASRTITVTVTADDDSGNADPQTNEACLEDGTTQNQPRSSGSSSEDHNVYASGCSSVDTTFKTGTLTLSKTNDPVEAAHLTGFNSEITYTITASAAGAIDQTGVVVTDILPGYDADHTSGLTNLADGLNSVMCKDSSAAVIASCATYSAGTHKVTANLGTITTGTSATVTITVKVPSQAIAAPPTTLDILNQAHASSNQTGSEDDVKSEVVTNVVDIAAAEPRAVCDDGTPTFDVSGGGFTDGDTVTMDIYDRSGNLVYINYVPQTPDYSGAVSTSADSTGEASFTSIPWPGFSDDGTTKTYPSFDSPDFSEIQVVLHSDGHDITPSSIRQGLRLHALASTPAHETEKVFIDYPTSASSCTPVALEITKANNPTSSETITTFGSEITYTLDVTAPETNLANARNVVVSDVLPGYDANFTGSGLVTYKPSSAVCNDGASDVTVDSTCVVTLTNSNHTVEWALGLMQPGEHRQVQFVVTVDTQGLPSNPSIFTLTNQASVDSSDTDPTTSNPVDNPANIALTAGLTVVKKASVSVNNPDKLWFKTVVRPRGKVVTYRYQVTNTGTLPISGISLNDDLNFGPQYGTSVSSSLDESSLTNCRVGGDGTSSAPSYGSTASFNQGAAIGSIVLAPGQDLWLYCDLLVPTSLTDAQVAKNSIFDKATVNGTTGLGPISAQSNEVIVEIATEDSDLLPFKAITNEDGTNYRKFDNLGRLEVPTLKTFRMFVDNVSTTPQQVTVYDYFSNESKGLSKANRDSIFNGMKCVNYNPTSPYSFAAPISDADVLADGAFTGGSENVAFTADTGGKNAGTWLARSQDLGIIYPEGGWSFVCQATLLPGEYDLTNEFRVISKPVLSSDSSGGSSPFRVRTSAAAVPAVTGKQDVVSTAGVELGTPVDNGGGAGGGVADTAGSPLPRTGADLVIPTAILGMLLVGLGVGTRRLARRTH